MPARRSNNLKAEPLGGRPSPGDRQRSIWKNRADADETTLIIDVGFGVLPGARAGGRDRNEHITPVGKNNYVLTTWHQPYFATQAIHTANRRTVKQFRRSRRMDCVRRRGNMLTGRQGNEVSVTGSSSRYFEMEVGVPRIKSPSPKSSTTINRPLLTFTAEFVIDPKKSVLGFLESKSEIFISNKPLAGAAPSLKSALICERSALSTELRDYQSAMAQETNEEAQYQANLHELVMGFSIGVFRV